MPRHNEEPAPKRHPNGKKRPRSWHRSARAGSAQAKVLGGLEPAFIAAAELDAAASVSAAEHRRDVKDFRSLLDGLARVSPCAGLSLPDPLV